MMTKGKSTKTVNFMTPGARVLVLGRGHMSYIENQHVFVKHIASDNGQFQRRERSQGQIF